MVADLKRVECFPNNAVPYLMRIVVPGEDDSYEVMLSYHHSKLVQLGQVKVFRNDEPVEYVSVATMEGSVTFEVIAEGDKLRHVRLPFGQAECTLPLELSSTSTHPLSESIRGALKQFPPLPCLDRFRDYTPVSVLVESEKSIVVPMATGRVLKLDPGSFFNVGRVRDDFLGCLFGPIGCAISVGLAIFLLSRTAR